MLKNIVRSRKRRVLVTAVTLGLMAAIASAAWLSSGAGPARGKVGTLEALVVQAGTPDGSTCLPGASCAGYLNISHSNTGDLTLSQVSVGGDSANDVSSNPAGCPASNLEVNNLTGLSIPLPAGGTPTAIKVEGLFTLRADAPESCAGVTITRDVIAKARTQ